MKCEFFKSSMDPRRVCCDKRRLHEVYQQMIEGVAEEFVGDGRSRDEIIVDLREIQTFVEFRDGICLDHNVWPDCDVYRDLDEHGRASGHCK